MEVLRDSTVVTDSANLAISGSHGNSERAESIPLKGAPTSSSTFLTRCCGNCFGFADDGDAGDGLKFITFTFVILSAAVTVALVVQIYHCDYQVVPHGSVATDNTDCSTLGTNILKKNGNAVDAAVASTLCMGVVNPHITGLGGGGFMLIYDHRKNEVLESLDFREAAPHKVSPVLNETVGPTTVAVPGLVSGLFAVHNIYGKLSWQEVVKPAADLARSGFLVPSSLVAAKTHLLPRSEVNAKLHDLVDTLEAGQTIKLPTLAATLELIASEGPDVFYNGTIAKEILAAVEGSSLTAYDLASYSPIQREALHESFFGFDIIVPGAPSGGPLLLAALQSLYTLNLTSVMAEDSTPLLLYRQAQAILQNYPTFFAESGDPDYNSAPGQGPVPSYLPEIVASHVAAVDLNDLYVSIVSGHNSLFGSQVLTEGGFVLNNALTSFDMTSPSPDKSTSVDPTTHYTNIPVDPNSSIVYPAGSNAPDIGTLVDHQTIPASQPVVATPEIPSRQIDKNSSINNPASKASPQSTEFLKRVKRYGAFQPGPRATVWGSSVANNELVGGKRPISLATPIIAIERGQICGRRLILGGSDAGIVAQVLSQLLVFDGNLTSSIEFPRVRINPSDSSLSLEESYATHLSLSRRQQLTDLGLQMHSPSAFNPSVNIVEKIGDVLASHSDSRGEGVASRF